MAASKRKFPDPRPTGPPRACGACRHDLTAAPLNQPCPQCGWRPSVRCITCGYDLTGLDERGPCPECGTPIAQSIRGDGLAFADVGYLRTLHRGLGMVRWGVLLVVLTFIGGIITLLAISAAGVQIPSWLEEAVISGLMMLSLGLYVGGWWVATAPDPRDGPEGDGPLAATIARYGAVAILVLIGGMLLMNWLAGFRDVVVAVLLLVFLVQHGAGSRYVHRLAKRAANGRAGKMARHAAAAITVVGVAWIVRFVLNIANINPPFGGGAAGSVARLAMALPGLLMFIGAIVAIARQSAAAGLVRDDLTRFLAQAHQRRAESTQA